MKYPLMRNNILREDLDVLIEYLKQDDPILTNGQKVREFEGEWSKWLGVKYSVFVNSGASANLLSMAILKIRYPEGGEVIVPPFTWISDIASVIQNGFTPVFVDIDPRSLALDTDSVIKKINNRTRAVFLTHAQGFNGLTDELLSELDRRKVHLIEDVCESHGACHKGRKVGSFGWMSNFSFYYAHHMSTIEGGMICTNDEEVYQQLRMLRSHGMVRESNDNSLKSYYKESNPDLNPEFIFAYPAYNVRNTELGGIMGLSQLKRLDANIKKRTDNFLHFIENLNGNIFQKDFVVEGSSNYAFNIVLNEANLELAYNLMTAMRYAGIEFRRGSAGGGNQLRQPYLKGIFPQDYCKQFPNTDHIHFYGFYVGNYPGLTYPEIDEICSVLNSI
ncbi:DegT/DnrJ/EryC1/StrS aminotransferase family protein [Chromobacterium sp. IIBBL 290-4]|uniref:DegT/DnrJ/EryC1/StrS family aminotransferase n=1 Tax=Chromobacterium sp. IIBBL 290-4 TaxID=2953890 RepID=UPI0020B823CC|nr:DegT/DnrJ/EryC1/StrS family aminotransferase [Chromobacterium sp. IIBBL 290-4]UTH72837.1 DegT/DnrJ/EryC1/StrS family aminotransferase [Chromobacterium sp. IIBBL 290-4]